MASLHSEQRSLVIVLVADFRQRCLTQIYVGRGRAGRLCNANDSEIGVMAFPVVVIFQKGSDDINICG